MMCLSVQPKDQIFVKGYGFLSFAKNISKDLSSKYSQKLLNYTKKFCYRCTKNCFKKNGLKNSGSKRQQIKLLIDLKKPPNLHQRIILKKILNIIEKYIENYIYTS